MSTIDPVSSMRGRSHMRRTVAMALCVIAVAFRVAAQPQKPQIAVKTLNGLALSVSDLQRSVEFYQLLFGMRNYAPQGAAPMLEIGSGPSFLTLRQGAAPGLDYITLGVQAFSAEDAMKTLALHGVTRSATPSTAPMTAWIVRRGDTPELFLNDPKGLKIQLQDVSYCGGSGPLGDRCPRPVMIKPTTAPAHIHTINHLGVSVPDNARTRKFFEDVFGMNGSTIGPGPQWMAILKSPDGKNGIDHYCFGMENFHPDGAIRRFVEFGLTLQEGAPDPQAGKATSVYGLAGPLRTRRFKQDRSAPGKEVPFEIFVTDPDQFTIQVNDVNYCPSNWGWLGDGCNPRNTLEKARLSRR
jgi:catechol 2,3-dioxygenase-like lactoylglutathione lyase family enzyme